MRGGVRKKRDVQWAFEGEKWILGSAVRFLWISTKAPALQRNKAKKKSADSEKSEQVGRNVYDKEKPIQLRPSLRDVAHSSETWERK